MNFEIGYAGVPVEFYDQFYSRRSSIARENVGFFGLPMKKAPYSTAYASEFIAHFSSLIRNDHHNRLRNTAFGLVVVEGGNSIGAAFLREFFPFLLTSAVKWEPDYGSRVVVERSINRLVETVAKETQKLKRCLSALGHELDSRANRTPLLLPLKNFRSSTFKDLLVKFGPDLLASNDAQSEIARFNETFARQHPLRKGSDKLAYYLDDTGVIFKAPGKNRHAFSRPSDGHPAKCLLSGRRRLGGPYDPAFHYDCTREKQSMLRGRFFGCHQDEQPLVGDPHLNIAPNDFVRK